MTLTSEQGPRTRMWEIAEANCIPLGAAIEITLRCNLRCVHCYNFDRAEPYPKQIRGTELTPPEIIDAIDQLVDAGCLFLSFTGGEALLHPHIFEFVEYARRRRCVVKVKTNGMLLTNDTVARLVAAGAHGVDISVYGATARTHDTFTRQLGSFDRTLGGIRHALRGGLDVKVNMCVVRSNSHEVSDMVDLVTELGVSYAFDPYITARYDGTTSSLDERIDRKTLAGLYRGPLAHLVTNRGPEPDRSVQCSCARSTAGISATGEVYPCIAAPVRAGNLREARFAEIWAASPVFERIRNLRIEDFAACEPCADRSFCARSSGVAYTNTGDYTGPEPFTCMDASVIHDLYDQRVELTT